MKNTQKLNLKQEHKYYDRVYCLLIEAPYRIIAIVSIGKDSLFWLGIYLIMFFILQFVILRFLCTHCPHYCKDSEKLYCMYLWNVKKIFRRRPGTPKSIDKNIVHMCYYLVYLFPVYWIWPDVLLLVVYFISILGFITTLGRYECTRCIYFDCPNNRVGNKIIEKYKDI